MADARVHAEYSSLWSLNSSPLVLPVCPLSPAKGLSEIHSHFAPFLLPARLPICDLRLIFQRMCSFLDREEKSDSLFLH